MKLRLVIIFFCTTASVLLLQSAFDQSDHKKSERAVYNYAISGRTLGPFLEKRAPGGGWSSEITHGCRGIVRVRYATSDGKDNYEFDYDVPGHTIHPGNPLGEKVLGEFAAGAEK